jgi:hypothetical protein
MLMASSRRGIDHVRDDLHVESAVHLLKTCSESVERIA